MRSTPPTWDHQAAPGAATQPLAGDISTEIAVVGAGISGLTTALRLQEAGRRVVVLDMGTVGGGTTGHSSGHLDTTSDQGLRSLIRHFGEAAAGHVVAAKRAAVEHVDEWQRRHSIACDFARTPAFLYGETAEDSDQIKQEANAARELGLPVEFPVNTELPFSTSAAMRFDDQARFDPLAYVHGLARVFTTAGGILHEQTRVEHVEQHKEHVRLATDRGVVTANHAVLAGHTALIGTLMLQPRIYAYQSYILDLRVGEALPDALYWDTAEPYHYTRRRRGDDPHRLILGGADHRTGETINAETAFSKLEAYARERYGVEEIVGRWSHEFYESADGLPFIGRYPGNDRIYIAAAFSGDGLTLGTAAGLLLSDLIFGQRNPWASTFSLARLNVFAGAPRFTSGMLHIAKHMLGDRLPGGWLESVDEIKPDDGGLVSTAEGRRAVYRDPEGNLHAFSPVCRHMGCIVQWNRAERTWDCPCHGGRYDRFGTVIMGPPKSPLPAEPLTEQRSA